MKLLIPVLSFLVCSNIDAQTLNIPLLTVNETAITYAQVDEIHFSLVIESHAKLVTEARNKNRAIAESVFEFLASKNIPKQFIQTKRMNISRRYIKRRPPIEYDGFNARQMIYVCVKELEIYDEIIDSLLSMEVQTINGPTFKSSKYEELLKSAQLKALKKAKNSAMEMANAIGQKVGKAKLVKTANSNNISNSGYNTPSASVSNFQSKTSSFEVGEIEIRASVEVAFELLE